MDDANQIIEPLRVGHQPVVLGTGLVALDVVIPNGVTAGPHLCAGGTCGNVLTALSYLGWRSFPVARLRADGASKQVAEDLRHWGVSLDFVTFDEDGSTPVVVQHIRNTKSGEPVHSFSRKCPSCGAFLPWYKAVRSSDVTDLGPRLPKPQAFFFDRTSRGALSLAAQASQQGALVFFEPSASSDPKLLKEALSIAHIVKVSSDRLGGNEPVLTSEGPKIVIETRGRAGLRLHFKESRPKQRARKWHNMSPLAVESLRDTAGAGDWCTAGIIYMLGAMGASGLETLSLPEVQQAVRVGQAMASWTCAFDGPRGGMYESDKAAFQKSIRGLLNGQNDLTETTRTISVLSRKANVFTCESCHVGHKSRPAKRTAHTSRRRSSS